MIDFLKLLIVVVAIALCTQFYAKAEGCVRNESGSTLLSSEGKTSPLIACDRTGKPIVVHVTPTATPTP